MWQVKEIQASASPKVAAGNSAGEMTVHYYPLPEGWSKNMVLYKKLLNLSKLYNNVWKLLWEN